MFIVFILLWLLDLITAGSVLKLLRCEESPDSWVNMPNYFKKNVFSRGLFCSYPCSSRYYPYGLFCKKLDGDQPSFCPQQLISQGFFKRSNAVFELSSLYIYTLTKGASFWSKSDEEKKSILDDFYNKRLNFLAGCYTKFVNQDNIPKTMCAHVDAFINKSHPNNAKVKQLCRQIYCDYKMVDKNKATINDGIQLEFCKEYGINTDASSHKVGKKDVITKCLEAIVYLTVIIVLSYWLFQIVKKTDE